MKILISFLIIFFSSSVFAKPKVLECKKNCGTSDTKGELTFQARLSLGSEEWGGKIWKRNYINSPYSKWGDLWS